MCGGLEEADGKSFVKQLALIYSKEPEKNSLRVQRLKHIGSLWDIISIEWINRKTLLTLKPLSKIQEPVGNLDHSPSSQAFRLLGRYSPALCLGDCLCVWLI